MSKVFQLFAAANDRSLCIVVASGDNARDVPQVGVCCAAVKSSGKFISECTVAEEVVSDPE